MKRLDFPFDEVIAECRIKAAEGARCYQKFSCSKCGQRLTMEQPNMFWHEGACDQCGTLTDIKAQGCNYMLLMAGRRTLEELVETTDIQRPPGPGLTLKVTNPGRLHEQHPEKQ